MASFGEWYWMDRERPLLYAVPGRLTSGEAEPVGGNGGLLSVIGDAWLSIESLRLNAEPLAVWRSLCRLQRSRRTNVLWQSPIPHL